MPRAYAITADAIAAERRRVDNDLAKFDGSRVLKLDEVTLRPMGSRDVHLRILAASLEHNVDHAALADTMASVFAGSSFSTFRNRRSAACGSFCRTSSCARFISAAMTVLDVMIQVGGLTDFADGNAARIFRVSEGGKLYSVRLRDLVKRGDITANADIRPGDILIIPQSWF